MQTSYTDATRCAIVGTENDDTDVFTAVTWRIQCDDADANGVCDGTFHARRQTGQRIDFSTTGTGCFTTDQQCVSPASAVTDLQTSIGGGRIATQAPEVIALLTGGDPRMTAREACDGRTSASACRLAEAATGVRTYIDLKNAGTENNLLVLRARHPAGTPLAGTTATKFAKDVVLTIDKVHYYKFHVKMGGIPGVFSAENLQWIRPKGDDSRVLPFSQVKSGCLEVVAKSFVRRAKPEDLETPARPVFAFSVDGDGVGVTQLPGSPGWQDEISRVRGGPRQGTRVGGGDGVYDWVEMRAWKYYENAPTGGVDAPPDPFQTATRILEFEPLEVFAAVDRVRSVFSASAPDGLTEAQMTQGSAHDNWSVSPRITFNAWGILARADEPNDEDVPEAGLTFPLTRQFRYVAAHEARHAWQYVLTVRSGPPSCNHETADCSNVAPGNMKPDNDDDLDELPERALLADGVTDVGISGRSAWGMIDTAGRIVLEDDGQTVAGRLSGDGIADPANLMSKAAERDAARFGRVVEALQLP